MAHLGQSGADREIKATPVPCPDRGGKVAPNADAERRENGQTDDGDAYLG
jgi:hypothetical protein